ncbi:MAG: exodeoxyribonuclease VII small subunit [Bdellovibrionia bacterium]
MVNPEHMATDKNDPNKTIDFEAAMEQLQATVKRLEGGELSLEQALQNFEEGVKLSRLCQQHLSAAEQRVEILMKATGDAKDGQIETQPFTGNKS